MQRHVPPFRTFLVALLLFIFAAEHAAHQMTEANARQKAAHEALLATPQGRAAEANRIRAEAAKERAGDLAEAVSDRATDLKDPDETAAKVGSEKITAGGRFGDIESLKATSDLYSGVSGTITAVNEELTKNPGLVNTDPFEAGWMVKIKATNAAAEMDKLLAADAYEKQAGH